MEFAKELYPTFEEASDATLELDKTQDAVKEFLRCVDTAFSPRLVEEAGKTLIARLVFLYEREKNRAKDTTDEDAHAEEARGA